MRWKEPQARPQGKRRRSVASSWSLPSSGSRAESEFSSFQNSCFEAGLWVFLGEGRGAERQEAADRQQDTPRPPLPQSVSSAGFLNLHFLAEWPWDGGS